MHAGSLLFHSARPRAAAGVLLVLLTALLPPKARADVTWYFSTPVFTRVDNPAWGTQVTGWVSFVVPPSCSSYSVCTDGTGETYSFTSGSLTWDNTNSDWYIYGMRLGFLQDPPGYVDWYGIGPGWNIILFGDSGAAQGLVLQSWVAAAGGSFSATDIITCSWSNCPDTANSVTADPAGYWREGAPASTDQAQIVEFADVVEPATATLAMPWLLGMSGVLWHARRPSRSRSRARAPT